MRYPKPLRIPWFQIITRGLLAIVCLACVWALIVLSWAVILPQ